MPRDSARYNINGLKLLWHKTKSTFVFTFSLTLNFLRPPSFVTFDRVVYMVEVIAFATLFAAYWVFNMQYPKTLNNCYNFIQKAIIHLKDGTPIPPPCKQLVQRLQKMEAAENLKLKKK
jgi:Ca2+/Na+ antiporter